MKDRLTTSILVFMILVLTGAIISTAQVGAERDADKQSKINKLNEKVSALAAAQVESDDITPVLVQELLQEGEKLKTDNAALKNENDALHDYIDGFNIAEAEKYDYAGHQKKYLETH